MTTHEVELGHGAVIRFHSNLDNTFTVVLPEKGPETVPREDILVLASQWAERNGNHSLTRAVINAYQPTFRKDVSFRLRNPGWFGVVLTATKDSENTRLFLTLAYRGGALTFEEQSHTPFHP